MAIVFKREKNERGVKLGSLKVGDTFLYDNRVGVMVERNGHAFALDLTTCGNFRATRSYGKWDAFKGPELETDEIVVPITIEMHYKVVG